MRIINRPIVAVGSLLVGVALLSARVPAQSGRAPVASVMLNAVAARDAMPAADGSLWRFEGPRDLQHGEVGDFGKGAHSGRINEVAIDPVDSLIMYATGATGGVWKTTDGGVQWASRSRGWKVQSATAIAIDPENPNHVLAGTGDYKRLDWVPPFSYRIMRSLDGGLTWNPHGLEQMGDFTVSRIVFDPSDSNIVFAATGRGGRLPGGRVFRSPDGGVNWLSVGLPDANWDDLEACHQGILWASATREGGSVNTGLVYRSLDQGVRWDPVTLASGTDPAAGAETMQIACDAASSTVLVAIYRTDGARVFRTTTSGGDWSEITKVVLPVDDKNWGHAAFGVTANFIYLAGVRIFRGSPDPADTAGRFDFVPMPVRDRPGHNDFQCAVPDSTETDAVFLCNDGGLDRYSAERRDWTSLSRTLGVTQIFRMDVHSRHGGLIAIGTQDLGSSVSFFRNGATAADLRDDPKWGIVTGGDGRSPVFRQDGTSRVYTSNTNGVVMQYDGAVVTSLQTSDGGSGGQLPLLFLTDALAFADTLRVRGERTKVRLRRLLNPETQNAGVSPVLFTDVEFRPVGRPPQAIQSLAVCPTNPRVIHAGSAIGQLFLSENGGDTWTEPPTNGLPPGGPVWTIAPSPANCRDVLIGIGYEGQLGVRTGSNVFHPNERLFRNANAGVDAWVSAHGAAPAQALPRAPIHAVLRHPSAPDSLWFAASDVGVFRTDDAGATWSNATAPLGLPNTLVRDLRLSGDGHTLYAGTFGRGVWSMDISRPAVDLFGLRGVVTSAGRPVPNASVIVQGAGRIRKFLKNTLTTGTTVTTAPIDVNELAIVSGATAVLSVSGATTVTLVTPRGDEVPMIAPRVPLDPKRFVLSPTAAAALEGQPTRGAWRFTITGSNPAVRSGSVELAFADRVSTLTGADGGYTIEYLRSGSHTVSVFDCDCQPASVNLTSHRTDVDFALNPAVSIVARATTIREGGLPGRFVVSRPGHAVNPLTVRYSVDGAAVNGADYQALAGTVTIPAGVSSVAVQVTPIDDALSEDTESVSLRILPAAEYTVAEPSAASMKIADNDPLPLLTIDDVTVPESGRAVFTVSLSFPSATSVTVRFATADGSAHGGALCGALTANDYLSSNGVLTFPPGTTSQPIIVQTCADLTAEGPQTFFVTLRNAANARFAAPEDAIATGQIVERPGPVAPPDATARVRHR